MVKHWKPKALLEENKVPAKSSTSTASMMAYKSYLSRVAGRHYCHPAP